jgi:hypothetical protein
MPMESAFLPSPSAFPGLPPSPFTRDSRPGIEKHNALNNMRVIMHGRASDSYFGH